MVSEHRGHRGTRRGAESFPEGRRVRRRAEFLRDLRGRATLHGRLRGGLRHAGRRARPSAARRDGDEEGGTRRRPEPRFAGASARSSAAPPGPTAPAGLRLVVNVRRAAAAAPFDELAEELEPSPPPRRGAARRERRPDRGRPGPGGARGRAALSAATRGSSRRCCPPACRFHPTCSEYAREAILRHGLARGAGLAVAPAAPLPPVPRGRIRPGALTSRHSSRRLLGHEASHPRLRRSRRPS